MSFWSVVFSYSRQQWIISQLDCDTWWTVDFIQQLLMTISAVGARRSSKALPKAKLAPDKSRGHCLVICCLSDPLHTVKPLYLRSTLSKSMRCTENYNAWNWYWSTEWVQFFSMTIPICTSHNQHFKSWINWGMKFCLICHIHLTSQQPIIMSSSILTTFSRENPSPSSSRQKMLSKGLSNPRTCTFVLQE